MVKSEERLDLVFAALGDPTRRAMVERLTTGERTVSELATPFAMSLPAVSKHLGVLERAGLVVRERKGRERWCRLTTLPLDEASSWFDRHQHFWTGRLDALGTYLEQR